MSAANKEEMKGMGYGVNTNNAKTKTGFHVVPVFVAFYLTSKYILIEQKFVFPTRSDQIDA